MANPTPEKYISPVTDTAQPARTTMIGRTSILLNSIPNAQVRKADITGFDAATTSENAAETNTRAEFSAPMERPNARATGSIPEKSSSTVGIAMLLPVMTLRWIRTINAANDEMRRCKDVTNFGKWKSQSNTSFIA